MRYFKLVTYSGDNYEVKEKYIDLTLFRKIQKALVEGSDLIVLEDRVIKRAQIKEIVPADSDIKEYLDSGVTLDMIGLKPNQQLESGDLKELEESGFEKIEKDFELGK